MQASLASCSYTPAFAHVGRAQNPARQPAGRPAAARQQNVARQRRSLRVASADSDLTQEELEEQLEAFMRRQAAIEGGEAARKVEPGKVLGASEVSEEEAKRYCREVVTVLKRLKEQRDMTLNEVRLTVAIEDPRARERRLMGMEDSSGVSRDEMAAALMEVSEGRIPSDRIALRELCREITQWPALDDPNARLSRRAVPAPEEAAVNASGFGQTPAAEEATAPWRREGQVQPPMGRDPREQAKSLSDRLPDWVGYGFLYFISIAPVLIAAGAITVLFLNSLR